MAAHPTTDAAWPCRTTSPTTTGADISFDELEEDAMEYDGPAVDILVVNGFDDAHRITRERLRIRRLGNEVTIVEGADAGLAHLLDAEQQGRLPGLVVADLDTAESERFLDGVRRASALTDLAVLALGDGSVRADLRPGSTTVHLPRPAGFAEVMAAVNRFGTFRFAVEMRELPLRYEAWMWLRHARVADLSDDAVATETDRALNA